MSMWGITVTILMNGETYTGKIKESLWRNDEEKIVIILRGCQPSAAFHKKNIQVLVW